MWFLLMAVKLNMTPSLTFMPIKVKIACVFLVRENLINSQSIQIYLYWLIMSQREKPNLYSKESIKKGLKTSMWQQVILMQNKNFLITIILIFYDLTLLFMEDRPSFNNI